MSKVVNLYKGDCLTEHERIESGSVDLILCDPPYGTMQGIAVGDTSWRRTNTDWDSAIPPSDIYAVANRILRKNGKMVLFSQEPYTSRLITEAIPDLPFNYRMIWEKDIYGNALFAKKAPLIFFEDILVFSKHNPTHDFDGLHPLREYFSKVLDYIGEGLSSINKRLGHRRAEHSFYITSTQFSLCTEETYNELINIYGIDRMDGFKPFQELATIDARFKEVHLTNINNEFPSVFNLWEGGKYKSNILRYKKDYDGYHPTQKPVALLDDLIRTYSNEGDLVVDLTMGSGSTGVAAVKAGRRFTGIELVDEYFDIAERRISESLSQSIAK